MRLQFFFWNQNCFTSLNDQHGPYIRQVTVIKWNIFSFDFAQTSIVMMNHVRLSLSIDTFLKERKTSALIKYQMQLSITDVTTK